MIPLVSIKTTGDPWASYKRYKVNEVVQYNGVSYQNLTGINTEPGLNSPNWYSIPKGGDSNFFSEVKIGDFWFDTLDNDNENAVEVGNYFRGYNNDVFVVGKVLGLPFDVNDENKVIILNKLISSNGSISIIGNDITSAISDLEEEFVWQTGESSIFTTNFIMVNLINVFCDRNGVTKRLLNAEYSINSTTELEMLFNLQNQDVITIQYQHKNELVNPQ
tara:strand:+ start:4882 stop:5538 length:657 start_codon:yes stop_codon:yes gene_type:complete